MNPQQLIAEIRDQLTGMWRYRWGAIIIAWVVFLCSWVLICNIPPIYGASAQVYVETNSMITPLLRGLTATQDTMDEVQLVSRAILMRPSLEQVARKTNLTQPTDSSAQIEQVVTRLQQNINVSPGWDSTFEIEYWDNSRERAVEVVAAVLDTFVSSSIGNQDDDGQVTEQALQGELRAHEERLLEAETRLADFKKENIGFMPDEYGDYAGRLQAALASVQQVEDQIGLLVERRNALERQLEGAMPVVGGPSGLVCSEQEQINSLSAVFASLRVNYTDRHPRINTLRETIDALEERCAEELLAIQSTGGGSQLSSVLEANPVYQGLSIQLNDAEVQLAELRAAASAQQLKVDQLYADVDKISQVETELVRLNRDYGVIQGRHQELLMRRENLEATQRLEPVTADVQFQQIEPPFAHANPVGPNRELAITLALLIALGAGGGVAFILNQVRPVFFTPVKLERLVGLPVLGVVTAFSTPRLNLRRRFGVFVWFSSCASILVFWVMAVSFANKASELFIGFFAGMSA